MVKLVHGTCVALAGFGGLLRGPPGAGKSDLALRFIFLCPNHFPGLALISDDQTVLQREDSRVVASSPPSLTGRLEVRGVGIIGILHTRPSAELKLIVDLDLDADVPRLPRPLAQEDVLGLSFPRLVLNPFEPSAALKLALAIQNFASHRGD